MVIRKSIRLWLISSSSKIEHHKKDQDLIFNQIWNVLLEKDRNLFCQKWKIFVVSTRKAQGLIFNRRSEMCFTTKIWVWFSIKDPKFVIRKRSGFYFYINCPRSEMCYQKKIWVWFSIKYPKFVIRKQNQGLIFNDRS